MEATPTTINTTKTAASVEELYLQFPHRDEIFFDGLSLNISKGEKVLLLGPSGSGKSTLLKVLTGLIPDTIEMPVQSQQNCTFNHWGYVFQDPEAQFCMPYVDEEIAFVLENRGISPSKMKEHIRRYLLHVGLQIDDPHRAINTLSQGQKQRLALASALALEPETLVLDEPTALLDPAGTKKIWERVDQISEEKTLLIVEHKVKEVINLVDRVLVLNDRARLIIDSTPEQIRSHHQSLLDDYGIWHTNSWSNYIQDSQSNHLQETKPIDKEGQPLLNINHLKGYHDDSKKVELSEQAVYPREWITITGPNGAGKSTLLLAIMQLIENDGMVQMCSEEITDTEQISADIGFVFQNPQLQFVAQTVAQEVAFTLKNQSSKPDQKVQELLTIYGLEEKARQNPFQLSTGEQRRLSVAATTVKKRKLLLLDEPTFGLDAVSTFAILEQLEKCRRQGTAIIMITHDRSVVTHFATRRWIIKNGELQADQSTKRTQKATKVHA